MKIENFAFSACERQFIFIPHRRGSLWAISRGSCLSGYSILQGVRAGIFYSQVNVLIWPPSHKFFFILTTKIITMKALISQPFRTSQVYRNGMLFRDQNNARQLKGTGLPCYPFSKAVHYHATLTSIIQPSTLSSWVFLKSACKSIPFPQNT